MADKVRADGTGIVKTFVDMLDGTFAERVVAGSGPAGGTNETTTVDAVNATSVTVPAQTAVGATAVTLLAANANRKRFSVQNTGTTTIYLSLRATDTNKSPVAGTITIRRSSPFVPIF